MSNKKPSYLLEMRSRRVREAFPEAGPVLTPVTCHQSWGPSAR